MERLPCEIFVEKITSQYNQFREKMLGKSKEEIYDRAYTIAKMFELFSFLTEEYQDVEKALPYVDNLLNNLADFETDYDTPQWTTWGEIENMLDYYIEEEKKKRKISGGKQCPRKILQVKKSQYQSQRWPKMENF